MAVALVVLACCALLWIFLENRSGIARFLTLWGWLAFGGLAVADLHHTHVLTSGGVAWAALCVVGAGFVGWFARDVVDAWVAPTALALAIAAALGWWLVYGTQWIAGYAWIAASVLTAAFRFMSRLAGPAVAVALGVLGTLGVRGLGEPAMFHSLERFEPGARAGGPPVLLISIDTLRWDSLSIHAEGGPPTPALDRMASEALLYERAYSTASWTYPAMVAMLSGVPPLLEGPAAHRGRLPEEYPSLAKEFAASGYRTAAAVHNPHLIRRMGLARGFHEYAEYPLGWHGDALGTRLLDALGRLPRTGDETLAQTPLASRWMAEHAGEPFFFWLHYLDPHVPYEPLDEFAPAGEPPRRIGRRFALQNEVRSGELVLDAEEKRYVRALYEADVRKVDREVGRLREELTAAGIWNELLVVVTSDHGEEFWEHGGFEHGHSLEDEVLRVPLMVKLPRQSEGRSIPEVVSTGQIWATLVGLAGVEAGEPECARYPALPGVGGSAAQSARWLVTSTLYGPLQAGVLDGDGRLSRDEELIRERVEASAKVRRCLGISLETEAPPLEDEERRRLRSLGYIQ